MSARLEVPAKRLTRDDWDGLICELCEASGWCTLIDHQIPESLLVLHDKGTRDTQVKVSNVAWSFTTAPGRLDYYPAGHYELHSSGPTATRSYVIRIPIAFENNVLEEGLHRASLVPRFEFHDRRLETLVRAMLEVATGNSGPFGATEAVMLSVAVVDRLHEISFSGADSERSTEFSSTVRRLIVEYLDMKLDAHNDIDRIAFLTGLARTQSGKAFRRSFGVPIHQYLINRRIEVALRCLSSTSMTVTEIAHDLGFASHAHFSTVFRQRVGKTPSQFRREHNIMGNEMQTSPANMESVP